MPWLDVEISATPGSACAASEVLLILGPSELIPSTVVDWSRCEVVKPVDSCANAASILASMGGFAG